MARAKRFYLPGLIWHITHRCHKREFLLKFPRDRRRWLYWLFQAKKRFNLQILGYTVTSNHVHILIQDSDSHPSIISRSLHLAACRTAQEYNKRKGRRGAYWEDRYHATAVESGQHLFQSLIYIDLNMVRAGIVRHPREWLHGGYSELYKDKKKYKLIDRSLLAYMTGFKDFDDFWDCYNEWLDEALEKRRINRKSFWTESVAVGSLKYVNNIASRLGVKLRSRAIKEIYKGSHMIREKEFGWRVLNGQFFKENGF